MNFEKILAFFDKNPFIFYVFVVKCIYYSVKGRISTFLKFGRIEND